MVKCATNRQLDTSFAFVLYFNLILQNVGYNVTNGWFGWFIFRWLLISKFKNLGKFCIQDHGLIMFL